jgi:hypothetical protein
MRLRSDIFVAALLRRAFGEGAHGGVVHRGDDTAGAVFVGVDRLDGTHDLYAPASQALSEEGDGDRRFERTASRIDRPALLARIASERRFDSDLWFVEIEDRQGRSFIEPPPFDPEAPPPPVIEWPPRL